MSIRNESEADGRGELPWAGGVMGAVSLTFDDAMGCHVSRVAPVLEAAGLRGTFYVNPTERFASWVEQWKPLAAAGHEIGSHTVTHPCSCNFSFITDGGLEARTLADIETDIIESNRRLDGHFGATPRSFGYPCYQTWVGKGPTHESYVPVVARHHLAARARGEAANHPVHADLHALWSWPCERMSAAEMIGLVESCAAEGRWGILTFHGVGEGHLAVGETDFQALCAHLARNRERLWTAPVIDIAQAVRAWRGEP
jgi:peptidoglycan-N-acetylglucosamine deacetylase